MIGCSCQTFVVILNTEHTSVCGVLIKTLRSLVYKKIRINRQGFQLFLSFITDFY